MLDVLDCDLVRLDTRPSRHRGTRNHHAGLSAEEAVLRHCEARGMVLLESRWRGARGEIDLIFRDGAQFVFVEVKAAARFAEALDRISPRQVSRIYAAAEEYLAGQPEGIFAETRFDAGLVDGTGAVELMEGVLLPY